MNQALFRVVVCIITLTISHSTLAQKIKSEEVTYHYRQLPTQPLPTTVQHYMVIMQAPYEEKNRALTEAYDSTVRAYMEKYLLDKENYPSAVKAAEENYEKALAAYNKKSFSEKLVERTVLNENNKPVKQVPSIPYLQPVPKPLLQTTYDLNVMAATHLHLAGYTPGSMGALTITVILYGYDYSQPRTVSEQKEKVSIGNGGASTYKATYYHTEFSYRHPMAIQVTTPEGKELLNTTPNELNTYKVYQSPQSENYSQPNTELLIKTSEEKVLQENLLFLNTLLNDKFGYAQVKRKAILTYVKNKDDQYTDLLNAFNDASSGLLLLAQDSVVANPKLEKAIMLWQKALQESDQTNKKARIDKDVAISIYFNLLELYFATANLTRGRTILDKMNTLELSSSERKLKNDFERLFADLDQRLKANH